MNTSLKGKIFIITGAGSGIGRHLVGAFLTSGAFVVAADIDEKNLKLAARKDEWQIDQVLLEKLDVRSGKSWKTLVQKTLKKWRRLDVVINNAGILLPGYVETLEEENVARHLDINARGVILGTATAARAMIPQASGHIINIASLAGVAGIPGISVYSASKHAVRGFSLAAAAELRPKGIFVTTICPDAVQTPMLDLQKDYEEAALTFSGGRVLTPVDIELAIRDALTRKPREILIPWQRGMLARIASAFPTFTVAFAAMMEKRGKQKQSEFRKKQS